MLDFILFFSFFHNPGLHLLYLQKKKKKPKENRRMNFSFSCKYWVIFSHQTSDLCIFPEFKSPCLLPQNNPVDIHNTVDLSVTGAATII